MVPIQNQIFSCSLHSLSMVGLPPDHVFNILLFMFSSIWLIEWFFLPCYIYFRHLFNASLDIAIIHIITLTPPSLMIGEFGSRFLLSRASSQQLFSYKIFWLDRLYLPGYSGYQIFLQMGWFTHITIPGYILFLSITYIIKHSCCLFY